MITKGTGPAKGPAPAEQTHMILDTNIFYGAVWDHLSKKAQQTSPTKDAAVGANHLSSYLLAFVTSPLNDAST